MKVLPTQTGDAAATNIQLRTENADTDRAFKAALTEATAETDRPEGVKADETYKTLDGHAYVEITSGKREGMFINTSGNVRNGEAFVVVRKNGKEYHIYGTGKDRLVVGFHMPAGSAEESGGSTAPTSGTGSTDGAKPGTDDLKLRKGEKIEPVKGHAYAEIVSGPRSGMYINTSGNSRHGEAFVLVEKADFNYHIYGSGADRLVVRAAKRDVDEN
ncbi:MAG TPA: hypothetical protein VFM58_11020 [Solirubrobacteraceae bacterium]|jgi:hypothetical protein|nr:hypothetical protein [Solirubrobacteraceae bacterium]